VSVSPATAAESMPFGVYTCGGPRNHVLGGGPDPPIGRERALSGVTLGHVQNCPWSSFSTIFAKVGSDAASGYQYCINLLFVANWWAR